MCLFLFCFSDISFRSHMLSAANCDISFHCHLRVFASCYLAGNDSITIAITADFQCWFLNTSQTAITLSACELFGFGIGSFSDVATGWENTSSFFFVSFKPPRLYQLTPDRYCKAVHRQDDSMGGGGRYPSHGSC